MAQVYQINNDKFGQFVAKVRKEKEMTQKELADQLFVSDKTVSKWKRGNSMPNVSLLIPLADVLDITVTELLQGEKLNDDKTLDSEIAENLVVNSLDLSLRETIRQRKKNWIFVFLLSIVVVIVEAILLTVSGIPTQAMTDSLYISMLCLCSQAGFVFMQKTYYRHIMIQTKLILCHREFLEYIWPVYHLIIQIGDIYYQYLEYLH